MGSLNSLSLEWAPSGGFHGRAISTLTAQHENFGVILDSSLPHIPLLVHQHILLALHSKCIQCLNQSVSIAI